MEMLSATLRSGSSDSSWNTQTMPRACACAGPSSRTAVPSTSTLPAVGCTTPETTLISVLLPAPFSPMIAWMEPARHASTPWVSAATAP